MITINISLELNADDPAQLGARLAAIIAGAQALAESGAVSVETGTRGGNVHAATETQQPSATTLAKKKRMGRPPKPIDHLDDWDRFDLLVRQEMQRLRAGDRMPGSQTWNNERDVRLPTMAGILAAYEAADSLHLSVILGLRPPMAALGVQPSQGVRNE